MDLGRGPRHVHPSFATPLGNTKIWRYLTTAKFLDMLQSNTLSLSRADLLGDPFEGSITTPIYDEREKITATVATTTAAQQENKRKIHSRKSAVKNMYVNCWHMNERESAAMWGLYGIHNESVAIVSTCEALCRCLPGHIYDGTITYIDYKTYKFDPNNVFNPFVYKGSSFSHENELRAVLWDSYNYIKEIHPRERATVKTDLDKLNDLYIRDGGAAIPIEINKLIERIYVNPSTPAWYKNAIEKLCRTYEVDKNVYQSDLLGEVLF